MSSVRIALALMMLLLPVGCKRAKQEPMQIVVTPAQVASAAGKQVPMVKVLLAPTGITIAAPGGNVAPGCQARGPGVAVPAKNDEQDFPELRRCLEKLKATTPELAGQPSIELVATKDIAFGAVIKATDAMRSTDDGRDLFPDVIFGPPAH